METRRVFCCIECKCRVPPTPKVTITVKCVRKGLRSRELCLRVPPILLASPPLRQCRGTMASTLTRDLPRSMSIHTVAVCKVMLFHAKLASWSKCVPTQAKHRAQDPPPNSTNSQATSNRVSNLRSSTKGALSISTRNPTSQLVQTRLSHRRDLWPVQTTTPQLGRVQ